MKAKNQNWQCEECGSTKKSTHLKLCQTCYVRKWNSKNMDKVNNITKKYRDNNKYKRSAWNKAEKSVLLKGICQICKERKAIERHHPNYNKKDEVVLVCRQCHKNIHSPKKTAPKHWDDVTHVAPKGEFKAEEFNLSNETEKISDYFLGAISNPDYEVIPKMKVREAVMRLNAEQSDFKEDIIALIEINNYGKDNLIAKMKRLCDEHIKEQLKIFGEKLTK